MTVAELIAQLQTMPSHLDVYIEDGSTAIPLLLKEIVADDDEGGSPYVLLKDPW